MRVPDRPACTARRQPCRGARVAARRGDRHDAAAGPRHAVEGRSGERPGLRQQGARQAATRQPRGIPAEQPDQRHRQRRSGQSVPARHQLPRLHRLAAARRAAGPVGVPGRRAHQRAVRRRRQLGPAAAVGDRQHPAHPRLEPAVRAQHAGRRARDLHQERAPVSRAARSSSRADRSVGARCRSSRAACRAPGTTTSPATSRKEHGWAEHNPSRIAQFFGKVGYETERDNLDVSLTAADNRLEGHADAAAVVPRRPPPGVHLSRHQQEPARRCSRSRAATSSTDERADRAATPTCAATATTTSRATSTTTSARSTRRPAISRRRAGPERSLGHRPDQLRRRAPADLDAAARPAARTSSCWAPARDAGKRALHPGIAARRASTLRGERFRSATSCPRRTPRPAPATSRSTRWTRSRSTSAGPLTASGRYNDARVGIRDQSGTQPGAGRRPRLPRASIPRSALNFNPTRRAHGLRELQRGHARADGDGADLRRPGRAVQAAEQLPGRSAAEEGRGARRSRSARAASTATRAGARRSIAPTCSTTSSSSAAATPSTPASSRTSARRGARGSS